MILFQSETKCPKLVKFGNNASSAILGIIEGEEDNSSNRNGLAACMQIRQNEEVFK